MTNLYEIQRQRMKYYGEMLKNDLSQKRTQQKLQQEANLKQDSLQIEKHILNTRKFDEYKRIENRSLNNSLREDNLMLSSLRKNASLSSNQLEDSSNFINQIHQMDSKRLNKLKNDLEQQFHDNKDFTTEKKRIQQRLRQVQRLEAERHASTIKQEQIKSVQSYQQIKTKHQQDMNLYHKHKRLVEQNDAYRDQIQSFTQTNKGLLDRYNRNEHLKRRASLRENQEQIVKQIQELDRRKSQQINDYKKNVSNLQDSMLASILIKPPRHEPRAYSNELKSQMQIDSLKRLEEQSSKKEKLQISGIFGGMQGNERLRMIQMIDKRLGIDRYIQQTIERRKDQNESPSFKPN